METQQIYPDKDRTRATGEMTCHKCKQLIERGVFYELDEYGEPTHLFCFPAK